MDGLVVSLVVEAISAAVKAVVTKGTKLVVVRLEEAKKAKKFKSLYKDLESTTISILIPLMKNAAWLVDEQYLSVQDLMELNKTLKRASDLVVKFRDVDWYEKGRYAGNISRVNKDIKKFFRMHPRLIELKYKLQSMALKILIDEAKKVKAFKSLFKELVSTMERLVPLTEKIDASRDRLDLDVGELKELKETIERANFVVNKCSRVRWFHICSKSKLQEEIVQVNTDMLKFCQMDQQLIQHEYQLQSMEANKKHFKIVNEKLDRLSARELL